MTHFLANEWDRTKAAKRGGYLTVVSLDAETLEERYRVDASSEESAEHRFDRFWAETVMDRALATLEAEHRAADKTAQFEALATFLSRSPEVGEYAVVGEHLGLNNHAVAVAVTRLRQRYRTAIRAEIAHTVNRPAEVDAELQYLIEVISTWTGSRDILVIPGPTIF